MRGVVQYINTANQTGIIVAEDGNTYGCTLLDCLPGTQIRIGNNIEFNIEDGVAVEIGPAKPFEPTALDLKALRQSVRMTTDNAARNSSYRVSGTQTQPQMPAREFSGTIPFIQLANDWRNILAALALFACILPFIGYLGISMSLFGTVSYASDGISTMSQARDQLERINSSPVTPTPWNRAPVSAPSPAFVSQIAQLSTTIWALRLSYLLYTIPLMAVLTLATAFRGRDNSRTAFWLGTACLSLPVIAICADYGLSSFKSQMPMGMGAMMPNAMSLLGMGFYLLSATGLALILVHRGVIGRVPPRAYVVARA